MNIEEFGLVCNLDEFIEICLLEKKHDSGWKKKADQRRVERHANGAFVHTGKRTTVRNEKAL